MSSTTSSLPTLNLVGAGRVGKTLARLWRQQGIYKVQAVCTRSLESARGAVAHIGGGLSVAELDEMPAADVWLLAVPDAQIAPTGRALAATRGALVPGTALHCSGFLPADTLVALRALGWHLASAHPALSFADPATAERQFAGTVCALEGDPKALQEADRALTAIGGRCFVLDETAKPLYHGAAVFASNFLPVLQAVAAELWQGSGVPPELVATLASQFLRNAADNVLKLGPAAALTGPAARGDQGVLIAQGAAMAARDDALGEAYRSLSTLAGRLARSGRALLP